MEKVKFVLENSGETEEFFVLEQTKMRGDSYLLVTDSETGDASCLILKDVGQQQDGESLYEIVEDDTELLAVSKLFEELLEDVEIEI